VPDLIEKYGAQWPADAHPLKIEMACLRKGGTWSAPVSGAAPVVCGLGRAHHFTAMRRLIWPRLDEHRWITLCIEEMCRHKVTTLMGSGGTGKTHIAACLYLMDYWVHPHDTIVLISSTDLRGLDLRVWGEMKKLFSEGQERFPWLSGHMLDSRRAISTDDIEEDSNRDLRKGVIGIPCVQGGKYVGLGKYIGIHQKRVRLVADEAQFMGSSFLSAFANLNQNEDFWAAVLGNPQDPTDPLGRAGEPLDGWVSHPMPDKTETWPTRFMDGICINLIGTDSPNFDFPPDEPPRFKYLPHRKQIEETRRTWGDDSAEYHQQCIGSMRNAMLLRRVVTRDACRQFRAQEDVTWKGTALVRILAVDAAYGGDRCVGGHIEFGLDIEGHVILSASEPQIIPIRIATKTSPEDQIAEWVKTYAENHGIPPENMFHDATGRGSLGTALARIWSAQTNPVEFGGKPTERPVSLDHYIRDPKTNQRRLLLCSEYYMNFVTELWYSLRFAIEAGQIRNLPESVLEELCMRQWDKKNFKVQVEPKSGTAERPGMKQRTGRSPDLADWFAIAVEGARRRGFNISRLANADSETANLEWLDELRRKSRELRDKHTLNYSA
jgi:hypothetical protein